MARGLEYLDLDEDDDVSFQKIQRGKKKNIEDDKPKEKKKTSPMHQHRHEKTEEETK